MAESNGTRLRQINSWLWLALAGGPWSLARGRRFAVGFPLAVLAAGAANYFAWRFGTNRKRK